MTDCPRGDVRDLLPDLLHGTLDEARRADVAAHVAACAACTAELELLRRMRGVVGRTPGVDPRRIAAAVVAARRDAATVVMGPAQPARVHARWRTDWRAAAAIAAVAVGLGAYALARRGAAPAVGPRVAVVPGSTSTRVAAPPAHEQPSPTQTPLPAPTTTVAEQAPPRGGAARAAAQGIVPDGGVGDLTDGDLQQLLQALDTLKAVPVTDPAQVTPEIDPANAGVL